MSERKRKRDEPPTNLNGNFKAKRKSAEIRGSENHYRDQERSTAAQSLHGKRNAQPKKHALGPLKKRIRDLRRQLSHSDRMPADVVEIHERELAACEQELAVAQAELQKQHMTSKYRMVRFFERKRAGRHTKYLTKQIEAAETDERKAELRRLLRLADVDLNYTMFFPLACPYSSLYPKESGKEEMSVEVMLDQQRGNADIRQQVEKAMEHGTLEQLRDRLFTKALEPLTFGHTAKDRRHRPSDRGRNERQDQKDDQSEDEFFDMPAKNT